MDYCLIEEIGNVNRISLKTLYLKKDRLIINKDIEELSLRKKEKLANNICKYINKIEVNSIAVSKEIKKDKVFLNMLENKKIKIFDGRILMKYFADKILDYIVKQMGFIEKDLRIAILSNKLEDVEIENIKLLAKKYKSITVATNNPKKILNLEHEFYKNHGISIIVSNNKKKTLLRQDFILNFDFGEDEINSYNFNNEAIIINFKEKIKIHSKRFNGINVCDYMLNEYKYNEYKYEKKDILEIIINFKTSFENVKNIIVDEKIENLICYSGNYV